MALHTESTRLIRSLAVIVAALAMLAAASPALAQGNQAPAAETTPAETEPVAFDLTDTADEDLMTALWGWMSKYRIGLDVEDGDWVQYESVGDGPTETLKLRLKRNEDGTVWLIETVTAEGAKTGTETHLHFEPGRPKVLDGFRVAEDGTRTEIDILEDAVSGELFMEARQTAIDALGGKKSRIMVTDCGEVQELTGPYGTFICRCVVVRLQEDLDPISFATTLRWLPEGTLFWLNEDVPRLLPMSSMLLPALLAPDEMMTVPGGMVKSHDYVLVDYSGRAE